MKILIHPDAARATECVADLVIARLQRQADTVLGLATGQTMEAVYTRLIAAYQAGRVSFAQAQSFNLDEYVGLAENHPCSYWHYMREKLFDHVDIDPRRAHLPHGDASDPDAEAVRYEQAIVAAGDIGLQLLGLGHNGHIGFNEPTSSLSSLTRIKTLTPSTRDANARFFDRADDVPRLAITMGIGTILRAHEVILLAYGAAKADAVAAMIEGPLAAACPASALQFHRKVTVVIDEAAAANLKLRDYYAAVHPDGREAAI
ncbi:MAG: glucosamine-6-phosphate deaminase [Deltaproteobacteria bacterium]